MESGSGEGAPGPLPWTRARAGRWLEAGVVAAVIFVFGSAFYWPALRCGVISDGWHLLHIGSRPLRQALSTRLDYHFSPGAHLLDGLLWRAFGMDDDAYQVENLVSLGVLAGALYALTRRIFRDPQVALVALLLYLVNASFHEVPLWPVVGNFQSFAALLYVAGVALALRSARPPRSWGWALGFGACALAAFFTYEPTLSLLPVGVLAALLGERGSQVSAGGSGPVAAWRRAVPAATAAAGVLAIALLVKAGLSAAGDRAAFLPGDLETVRVRALFLLRAVVAVFTLRAADTLPARALSGALGLRLESAWFGALAAGLLLALLAGAAVLVWRGSGPVRFATLWLGVHFLMLAAVTTPESRHNLIAALPAAMLASAALWTLGRALARRRRLPLAAWPHAPAWVPLVALLLLVPGSSRDFARAARLYGEGTAATRELRRLVEERLGEGPALVSVSLVNLPAKVYDDGGLGAYWFINGAHFLVELATHGEVRHQQVSFFHTREPEPGGEFANGSLRIRWRQLARRIRDPSVLVLAYDAEQRTVVRLRPPRGALGTISTGAGGPGRPVRRAPEAKA
jgi:hypothetical protein